jgi:hypothetical protein
MSPVALNRPTAVAVLLLAIIGVFYLLREHWGHALGALPYLLLLACPLLHLFHGHGSHGHHPAKGVERERRDDSP